MGEVIDLGGRREPVTYTIRLRQYHDGRLAFWVQDVADTPEDRLRVAEAMRRAAEALEEGADART